MASGGGYASFSSSSSFSEAVKSTKPNGTIKVLECKVCEDVFSLQGERVPRLLHCGHTLCHACLLRLPLREDFLQCPFDRQPTPIGSSGVWGLKKNFALLELLEKLQHSSEKTFSLNVFFNETEPAISVSCDENEDHAAVLYCMVCGTHLCMDCAERTHSTRTLIRHKRVPLSEKPRERPKCPFHPSHSVEFACLEESCQDAPLLCFICKDYGRHKGHSHALLDMEAEKLRNSILSAMTHMKVFMEEVTEVVQRLEHIAVQIEGVPAARSDMPLLRNHIHSMEQSSNTGANMGTADDARLKIKCYFRQLYEQLALQEAAALTVVDTHVRERLCSIRQRQEDLAMLLSQAAEVCVQCERAVRQDDARLVVATRDIRVLLGSMDKQKSQLAELSPELLQLDPSIPITFTKDNRVHIGPKIEVRVVTLGLDGAGKTSLLFKLKQNEFITTIPTIGFNVESIEYKNLQFTFWDVGGQPKLRPLWKHYYLNTQAVIFVVDSSCPDRLAEVQSELTKLLAEKELKDAALLILANKQDVANAASVEDLTEQLTLLKLCYGRSWHAQGCDAPSGTGLLEGLDWLSCQLVSTGVYSTTSM